LRRFFLAFVAIFLIIGPIFVFFSPLFEKTPPKVKGLENISFLGKKNALRVLVIDEESGLKNIKIYLQQGKIKKILLESSFSKETKSKEILLQIIPGKIGLKEGEATLAINVKDHSLWHFGRGNANYIEQKVSIDLTSPFIHTLGYTKYVYLDGTGLVIFFVSKDAEIYGVKVGERFFKGYVLKENEKEKVIVCFFAALQELSPQMGIFLFCRDKAGNEKLIPLAVQLIKRKRKKDTIYLTDGFILQRVYPLLNENPEDLSYIKAFKMVNETLRKKDEGFISTVAAKSSAQKMWRGSFVRLRNSKVTATFGDMRTYFYKGKKVGSSVHFGYDLASVSHAPVPAANHGKVIFADNVGVFGNVVVIDHGFGLASLYAHLADMKVKKGDYVRKGQVIGHTDTTGFAGGDHLHFAIFIDGIPVNPIEWWDKKWVRSRIETLLASYL